MSKSILVIDTPESCPGCLLKSQIYGNQYMCCGNHRRMTIPAKTDKPDWCPLKELPGIMEQLHDAGGCDGSCGYARGWDDAMEEAERILTGGKQKAKPAWKEHIENRFGRVE